MSIGLRQSPNRARSNIEWQSTLAEFCRRRSLPLSSKTSRKGSDRLSSNTLTMTRELIANMLGVRREGVTEAAGKLQELGVIRYARGRITVLNRRRLEQLCCECYAVVKKETDRLLPDTKPA
jgi:CRP-like cAMP-binding protein